MFEQGPCEPWTSATLVKACDSYADLDDAALETPIEVSSELLYHLSGFQFPGECEDTVRPVQHDSNCRCGSCSSFQWTKLGHAYVFDTQTWPIRTVTEVLIDGVPMNVGTDVIVHDGRFLVRRDGQAWPVAQRLNLPTTEQGTWSLTFTVGQSPPASGVLAASTLAGELSLACGSEDQCKKCRLSKRVQQVSRQGMSMILLDPFQFLDKGRLGIVEVDMFITTFNPEGLRGEPIVASPDIGPTFVRQTWP